ncbi:MAG: TIGR02301 family protein [Bosea sp.]|nr:TIGR02301 family protein [Bosea sp. (in: a-proteobacteria)]
MAGGRTTQRPRGRCGDVGRPAEARRPRHDARTWRGAAPRLQPLPRRISCVRVPAAALVALLALSPVAALAQQRPASPAKPAQSAKPPEPAPPEPDGPPYEPQLLQLAEIMGSLAYLRTLCGGKEAQDWRDRMAALIEAEGRTPQRRDRLTAAFNRGFRAYSLTHRACTDASQEAAARLADQGGQLSRALAGRYGG